MKFCDKCKGIVVPDKTGKKMVCGSCGKIYKKEKLILKEDIKKTEKVEVVDSNVDVNPKVDIECPKCGHGKASFWSLQNEKDTFFLLMFLASSGGVAFTGYLLYLMYFVLYAVCQYCLLSAATSTGIFIFMSLIWYNRGELKESKI